jgi:hypothetical protein
MMHWVELLIIFAIRFMWSSAWDVLKDCFIVVTAAVAIYSAFYAHRCNFKSKF